MSKNVRNVGKCVTGKTLGITSVAIVAAVAAMVIVGVVVAVPLLYPQPKPVRVTIVNDFYVEIWDGGTAKYVRNDSYYPNGLLVLALVFDAKILDTIDQAFADDADAIIDGDILENATIGGGYIYVSIPPLFATPGNETLAGKRIEVAFADDMIVFLSLAVLLNNDDVGDLEVSGGLESDYTFIDEMFGAGINKTMYDEMRPDLHIGSLVIDLLGCYFYNSTTNGIYANLNGAPVTFEYDFFVSP